MLVGLLELEAKGQDERVVESYGYIPGPDVRENMYTSKPKEYEDVPWARDRQRQHREVRYPPPLRNSSGRG